MYNELREIRNCLKWRCKNKVSLKKGVAKCVCIYIEMGKEKTGEKKKIRTRRGDLIPQ